MQFWDDMWPELLVLFFLIAMAAAMFVTLSLTREAPRLVCDSEWAPWTACWRTPSSDRRHRTS